LGPPAGEEKHFKTETLETLDKFNPNQGGNGDRGPQIKLQLKGYKKENSY